MKTINFTILSKPEADMLLRSHCDKSSRLRKLIEENYDGNPNGFIFENLYAIGGDIATQESCQDLRRDMTEFIEDKELTGFRKFAVNCSPLLTYQRSEFTTDFITEDYAGYLPRKERRDTEATSKFVEDCDGFMNAFKLKVLACLSTEDREDVSLGVKLERGQLYIIAK